MSHVPLQNPVCLTSDSPDGLHDVEGSEECLTAHTWNGVAQMPCRLCRNCGEWVASQQDRPEATAVDAFSKEGKALYAVAIEKTDGRGNVEAKIFHIHATDANEALVHYQVVYPNRRTHRIVGAAPCIGYFVENREGTIVSAS